MKSRPSILAAPLLAPSRISKLLRSNGVAQSFHLSETAAFIVLPQRVYDSFATPVGGIAHATTEFEARGHGLYAVQSGVGVTAALCLSAEAQGAQIRFFCWLSDQRVARWLIQCASLRRFPVVMVCLEKSDQVALLELPFELDPTTLRYWYEMARHLSPNFFAAAFVEALRQLARPNAVEPLGLMPPDVVALFALSTERQADMAVVAKALLRQLAN